MQALNIDYNPQDFEPKVRQFAPMIETLSIGERFALVKLIMDMPFMTANTTPSPSKIHERFNRHPNAIIMKENFDEDLGDDFWLGESK